MAKCASRYRLHIVTCIAVLIVAVAFALANARFGPAGWPLFYGIRANYPAAMIETLYVPLIINAVSSVLMIASTAVTIEALLGHANFRWTLATLFRCLTTVALAVALLQCEARYVEKHPDLGAVFHQDPFAYMPLFADKIQLRLPWFVRLPIVFAVLCTLQLAVRALFRLITCWFPRPVCKRGSPDA